VQRELPVTRRYQPGLTVQDARAQEMMQAHDLERASRYPLQTGAVDPRERMLGGGGGDGLGAVGGGGGVHHSELAGVDFSAADFRHSNMQPFFGGALKTVDPNRDNGALMERFTGAEGPGNSMRKQEVEAMFGQAERPGAVHGAAPVDAAARVRNRLDDMSVVNRVRNNVLPFEQVRVGPGVGQGYTAAPRGGFGHNEDRDYVQYKTINELRPGNKPRHVMEGRVNHGALPAGSRGLAGDTNKNRPEMESYLKGRLWDDVSPTGPWRVVGGRGGDVSTAIGASGTGRPSARTASDSALLSTSMMYCVLGTVASMTSKPTTLTKGVSNSTAYSEGVG
jgi:hypothetical protein